MSRKSIRLKIFLARLLVVVMVVTSIPFYQKQEAKAAGNLLWPVSGGKLGCGFNCFVQPIGDIIMELTLMEFLREPV